MNNLVILLVAFALLVLGLIVSAIIYHFNKKFRCPYCRRRYNCRRNPADICTDFTREKK